MTLGVMVSKKLGLKAYYAIIAVVLGLAIFASSYSTNFWVFFYLYGVNFGLCMGMIYMPVINLVCNTFPERKGILTGVILSASGLGSFMNNFVMLYLINPENLKPIHVSHNEAYYFGPVAHVAMNLPKALRINALYNFCFLSLGALIVRNFIGSSKSKPAIEESHNPVNNTEAPLISTETETHELKCLRDVFYDRNFYILFFKMVFASCFPFFIVTNYKVYGFNAIKDSATDVFLTFVGSMAMLSNSVWRIFWGALFDRFGFKLLFRIMITIQLICIGTFSMIAFNKYLFMIWILTFMVCEGGYFCIFPAYSISNYGKRKGAEVYGLLMNGFTLGNIIQFVLSLTLVSAIGFDYLFYVFFALTFIPLVLSFLMKSHPSDDFKIAESESCDDRATDVREC